MEMQRLFEVVDTIIQRSTRMPRRSQLLLKILLGLEEGMSVQFKCIDYSDAFRTSKALVRFIYDARKSGKLQNKYSVHRSKIEKDKEEGWFVFIGLKK